MASSFAHPILALTFVIASAGCGDDGGGDPTASTTETTAGPGTVGTADDGPGPTTGSGGPTAGDADGSTMPPDDDGSSTGAPSDDSGSGTEGASSSSAGETETDAGSSSSTGGSTGIPECDACEDDEVCVAYQAFQTTYECHPMPKSCEGDVDCDCGAALCVEPYIGCFDPPEESTLFCACIAC